MRISDARASASSGSFLPSSRLRAGEQLLDRLVVERLEHQHTGPRQQWRVQLERRVLGRRANEHDGAVLHHRQEGILLRAVEAVNLVDEQQRPLPGLRGAPRRLEDFLQIGDAGEDRRDLLEMQIGLVGQQPRDRGLAGAGRAPEDQRAERPASSIRVERTIGPSRWSCPTTSPSLCGRSRSASGRGA